jgi:hypothetical protein
MSKLVLSTPALHNCNPHSSPKLLEHNIEISSFPFRVDQRRDPHTIVGITVDTLSTLGSLFSLPLTPCIVRVGDRSLTGYRALSAASPLARQFKNIIIIAGGGVWIYPFPSSAFRHCNRLIPSSR